MSWAAVPCSLRDCPRLHVPGIDPLRALGAIVAAYLYSSEHETDGVVPRSIVAPDLVDPLRTAGIFRDVGDRGLEIVAFLDTNQSAAQREQTRIGNRDRKRSQRSRHGVTNTVTHGVSHDTEKRREEKKLPPPSAVAADAAGGTSEGEPDPTRPPVGRNGQAPKRIEHPSPAQAFWQDEYVPRYFKDTGGYPTASKAWMIALGKKIAEHGYDRVKAHLAAYFDDPPFELREGAREFGRFLHRFDLLAGRARQPFKPMPPAPRI